MSAGKSAAELGPTGPTSRRQVIDLAWLEALSEPAPLRPTEPDSVLRALHAGNLAFTLEIFVAQETVRLAIGCPVALRDEVERAVRGTAPAWQLQRVDGAPRPRARCRLLLALARAAEDACLPLPTLTPGESDPIGAVLEAVQPLAANEQMLIRFALRPASKDVVRRGALGLTGPALPRNAFELGLSLLGNPPRAPRFEPAIERTIQARLAEPAFNVLAVVALVGDDQDVLASKQRSLQAAFADRYRLLLSDARPDSEGILMTSSEAAGLWHLPDQQVTVPGLRRLRRPVTPLPARLQEAGPGRLKLGHHMQRHGDVPVYLDRADLDLGHAAIIGRTGTGKSTLIHHLLRQLLESDDSPGVALIDPHGDLVHDLIRRSIPSGRLDDVVLIDLADAEYPVGLPLFSAPAGVPQDVAVQTTFSLIRLVFRQHWSPTRMEDLIFAITAALYRLPSATLLDVPRLVADPAFRHRLLRQVDDPVATDFWREFEALSESARREMVRPVLYRLRAFYRAPAVRRIVCQPRGLDSVDVLRRRKILLVSLAGQEVQADADILGELVIGGLHLAALGRLQLPQHERQPFYLAVDESQRFQGASLPILLSEGRKLGVPLLLATQFLGGWSEAAAESVLGNVGTLIAFRSGVNDSHRLAASLKPFTSDQLENLDRHEAVIKMQSDGATLPAFDIRTAHIRTAADDAVLDAVRARTRRLYAARRSDLDATWARSEAELQDAGHEVVDEA